MHKYVNGDLIELALKGEFDVIAHGCNCFCQMGKGLAPKMAMEFGCNNFPLENIKYKGDINKLGQIDYKWIPISDLKSKNSITTFDVAVVNCYTQYKYGRNHADGDMIPVDYEAITLCMRKIKKIFKGKRIGLPKIGAGLAGVIGVG